MRSVFLLLLTFLLCFNLTAQVPVEGGQLEKALGQRQTTSLVSKLNNYIGEDFKSKGVQIIISDSKLTRIDLYNDENVFLRDMTAFKGELPLGLTWKSTIFEAKKKLGEDFEEEGDKGGTFTLVKEFPLNELDAWQINVMFNKGRMNMISMLYVENGRAAAEDAEMVKATGLSGEDYFFMIKKNKYNFHYKMLMEQIGYPEYNKNKVQVYLDEGLQVEFSKKETIQKLTFYAAGQSDSNTGKSYKQFPMALPYGLKFADNRNLVKEKIGPPIRQTANSMIYSEKYTEMEIFFSGNTVSKVEIYNPKE